MLNPAILEGISSALKSAGRSIGKWLGRDTVKIGASIALTAAGTVLVVSKWKDHANEELNKKHDKEVAERLTKEFERRMEEVSKKYENNEKQLRNAIIRLCHEFGIDPDVILKG